MEVCIDVILQKLAIPGMCVVLITFAIQDLVPKTGFMSRCNFHCLFVSSCSYMLSNWILGAFTKFRRSKGLW